MSFSAEMGGTFASQHRRAQIDARGAEQRFQMDVQANRNGWLEIGEAGQDAMRFSASAS